MIGIRRADGRRRTGRGRGADGVDAIDDSAGLRSPRRPSTRRSRAKADASRAEATSDPFKAADVDASPAAVYIVAPLADERARRRSTRPLSSMPSRSVDRTPRRRRPEPTRLRS